MSAEFAEAPPAVRPAKLFAPGDMVDRRYRIESYLGGGGMASVYRATHVVLEQTVAIKVISPAIRELPGMAQRFLREAKAATHLKSEHVARVSDVGTMADGAPYMVMEYLDGNDLDAILESNAEIPIEDAVDYVLQACEALAEVHGLGIVHRDLKPANLFLTSGADGRACVKLIDFGISRIDSPLAAKDRVALTQPETVMGSPRYMSPEQMESSSKADSRSDIYGVGAVLYELLTRRAPHEGETFLDIYAAATLGPPEAPSTIRPDVPRELDEAILRCLRINPDERYADTAELAHALAPFGPAGSDARAEAIARIQEASRARTQSAGADDVSVSTADASHVRHRTSSSAYSVRRRRIRYAAVAFFVIALMGLAAGGRALYSQGHANGVASAELGPAPTLTAAPPTPAPSATQRIDPALAAALAASAALAAAAAAPSPPPASALNGAGASTPPSQPVLQPAAQSTPPPAPQQGRVPTSAAPQPLVPSNDERTLFEDRK